MIEVQNTEPQRIEGSTDRAIGFSMFVGGVLLAEVGVIGIDSNEAVSSEDALASITFNDAEAFITTADLGFGALTLSSAVLAAVGFHKLLKPKR